MSPTKIFIENDFFTVTEIAGILKLSVLTIYKYIREERIEVVQFGGHYRIPKSALKKFINDHKIQKHIVTDKEINE